MSITTIESLRVHLQTAIEIEHSTLPPYLCALYSIIEGHNAEAAQIIQSVVLEEMLHLTLAANLLNAIGGRPVLDSRQVLVTHPRSLPHSDRSIELSLRPFTPAALDGFMAIERPGAADAAAVDEGWSSIGQFYRAIDDALVGLAGTLGETALFCGDPARQVTDALYYGGSGRIFAVTDLASARQAVDEIVEQGEGLDHDSIADGDTDMFHPERDEVAHYFRFRELAEGRRYRTGDTPASGPTGDALAVDWAAVRPMRVNPLTADLVAGSPARRAAERFNSSYCTVLQLLEQCFNGKPTLLAIATGAMYGLRQQMIDLMGLPSGDGLTAAGPTFQWVPPERRLFTDTQVVVVPHGPYLVSGDIEMYDAAGEMRLERGVATLCRCGGSHTKPFCDGTHARIGFDGTETASHDTMAERRRSYPTAEGVEIYDDRTRCAHFGQCTGRLPAVFGASDDAFVAPGQAPTADIVDVVSGCPSGALTHAATGATTTTEVHETPCSVRPIVDGPYRLRGSVPVIGADGQPFEVRERQTLCRCGKSRNKPFCDGSHWYAGFRDPLPPELADAATFPWDDPDSAEHGRQAYAARVDATPRSGDRP